MPEALAPVSVGATTQGSCVCSMPPILQWAQVLLPVIWSWCPGSVLSDSMGDDICCCADSRMLLTACDDMHAHLYDVEHATLIEAFSGASIQPVLSIHQQK